MTLDQALEYVDNCEHIADLYTLRARAYDRMQLLKRRLP